MSSHRERVAALTGRSPRTRAASRADAQGGRPSRADQAGRSPRTRADAQIGRSPRTRAASRADQAGRSPRTRADQAGRSPRTRADAQIGRSPRPRAASRADQSGRSPRTRADAPIGRSPRPRAASRADQAGRAPHTRADAPIGRSPRPRAASRADQAGRSPRTRAASRVDQAGRSPRTSEAPSASRDAFVVPANTMPARRGNDLRRAAIAAASLAVVLVASRARADATATAANSAGVATPLVALAPHPDDARKAVAIGPGGEVYAPDGEGRWVRTQRIATGDRIVHAGRAGGDHGPVVAFGEGVVYRLAPNGWSAIRLHQKQRAVMSAGLRAVAAVGRQLFVLDRSANGEPMKLATVPGSVLALGTGGPSGGVVAQTERGLFRIDGTRVVPVKTAPKRVSRVVSDRWVLVDDGAIDLRTGRKTGWPPDVQVAVAAVTPDDRLVLVTRQRGALELVTVRPDKLAREPIVPSEVAGGGTGGSGSGDGDPNAGRSNDGNTPGGIARGGASGAHAPIAAAPVDVAVDRAGRAVVALADGTLLVRASGATGTWGAMRVTVELPPPRPGAPPAKSP